MHGFSEVVAPRVGEAQANQINGVDSFGHHKAVTQSRASLEQVSSAGVIYFIRAGKTKFVKIGWTRDLRMRLSGLQTGNQAPLKVLRAVAGSREGEAEIQNMFRRWRRQGEWFWFADEIAQFIKDSAADCIAEQAMRWRKPDCLSEDEVRDILAQVQGASPSPDILAEIERLKL